MPQKSNIVATKTNSGDIYIFDLTKHPKEPSKNDDKCSPQIKLKGHKKEGYGLCWSKKVEGRLVSGSDDYQICIWDDIFEEKEKVQNPTYKFSEHENVVEDVCWHNFQDSVFGSGTFQNKAKLVMINT
jgi:histone-binding protein RBBP4